MTPIPSFAGRKVLITGGTGFLGSNVAHRLVRDGARVSILASSPARTLNLRGIEHDVEMTGGDIQDADLIARLVAGMDDVFHFASQTSHLVSMDSPHRDLAINGAGTLNVLEACRQCNRDANLVFTGTVTQAGAGVALPVNERSVGIPLSIYEAHKNLAEDYLVIYHRQFALRTTTLRLSNVFGERQQVTDPRRGVVNVMIRRAMRDEAITVYGTGQILRDYNYVQNVVDACLLAAASPQTKGEFFAVGSGIGTRFGEMMGKIVDAVALRTGRRTSIEQVPFPSVQSKIDQGDYVVDASRFRDATGWSPRVSLDEGLAATVDFYQRHLQDYLEAAEPVRV